MLVTAMCLAGSSVVVAKLLTDSLPVFLATFCTLLVALICMLPLMRNRWGEINHLTLQQFGNLFLQGFCGIVLFRVFILYGLKSTGAVEAGIITGTTPAILAILSWFMLHESFTLRSAMGILCAASGCILINFLTGHGTEPNSLIGCLLVVAAVVSESLFTILRKQIADSVSATTNTTVLLFCSLLLLLPPALYEAKGMTALPDLTAFLAILYYGVFATVLAYLLWTHGVTKVSGTVAGAASAAMPASAMILGVIVLGEELSWEHIAGCLLIITGILVTSWAPARQETTRSFSQDQSDA